MDPWQPTGIAEQEQPLQEGLLALVATWQEEEEKEEEELPFGQATLTTSIKPLPYSFCPPGPCTQVIPNRAARPDPRYSFPGRPVPPKSSGRSQETWPLSSGRCSLVFPAGQESRTWPRERRIPALLKTQVEMLAPVLMRYSTSRLASTPAEPEPWGPMTWSTRERWGNLLPNSCMNSARSAGWKYCSRN